MHHDVDASDGLAHHADLGQLGGSTTGHLYIININMNCYQAK
jgi:hypothetical protein